MNSTVEPTALESIAGPGRSIAELVLADGLVNEAALDLADDERSDRPTATLRIAASDLD